MVTGSTGTNGFSGIPGLKDQVYENRMSYAHRHGYGFFWANFSSYGFDNVPAYWNKIPILQEAFERFPEAKWLWWLDLDAIIMTPSLDLHTHVLGEEGMRRNIVYDAEVNQPGGSKSGYRTPAHIDPKDVNFLIASGGWGLNVGSFLLKRGDWADWLLEMWADPLQIQQESVLPENDAWTRLWRAHKIVRDHTGCTNQRALNAYPSYNALGAHWQESDLLMHFAGCGSGTSCPEKWQEAWNQREPYEVPGFIKTQLKNDHAHIEDVERGDGLKFPTFAAFKEWAEKV